MNPFYAAAWATCMCRHMGVFKWPNFQWRGVAWEMVRMVRASLAFKGLVFKEKKGTQGYCDAGQGFLRSPRWLAG